MATVRELLVSLGVNADNKKLLEFDRNMKGVEKSSNAVISTLGKFSGVVAIALSALGGLTLGGLIKESIDLSDSIKRSEKSLGTIFGDLDLGKKKLEELRSFAEKTPFEFNEVKDLAVRLAGVGFTAEELIPTLKGIGDAASVAGKEKLPQIVKAITDIKAKGRVMGQELTSQLAEAGIPLDMLAKKLGMTKAQLIDSRGTVTAERFIKAFMELSKAGGIYYKGMANLEEEWSGQISQSKDIFDRFKASFGDGFIQVILPVLQDFNKWLQTNKEDIAATFKSWGDAFGKFAKWVIEYHKPILIALGLIATFVGGILTMAFYSWAASVWAATLPILPLILLIYGIIAAVGALIYLIYELYKNWSTIWGAIRDFFLNYVINPIVAGFDWLQTKVTDFANFIFQKLAPVKNFLQGFANLLKGSLNSWDGTTGLAAKPRAAAVTTAGNSNAYNTTNNNKQVSANIIVNGASDTKKAANDIKLTLEDVSI